MHISARVYTPLYNTRSIAVLLGIGYGFGGVKDKSVRVKRRRKNGAFTSKCHQNNMPINILCIDAVATIAWFLLRDLKAYITLLCVLSIPTQYMTNKYHRIVVNVY